ncbi:MAG: hypothetical protein F4146_02410 [Rhodothermaceae bacterium]|nr:hypothetical protein [Rhodothermaceae bacterium]MYF41408.1 hypothetical protein [Rhodothermaceae bacterium]MYH07416.1 hypothetical protein [Rhodothermaceae bacterium]
MPILQARANSENLPSLCVDAKKNELIGCFRNPGTSWLQIPMRVCDHGFRSLASGTAILYGVYDLRGNTGSFYVGTSDDTTEFAVGCFANWWKEVGQIQYPHVHELWR